MLFTLNFDYDLNYIKPFSMFPNVTKYLHFFQPHAIDRHHFILGLLMFEKLNKT